VSIGIEHVVNCLVKEVTETTNIRGGEMSSTIGRTPGIDWGGSMELMIVWRCGMTLEMSWFVGLLVLMMIWFEFIR
jgi:hypothetical protein